MRSSLSRAFERIYQVVRAIPRGHVMTYGQVAAAAGMPRGARVAGYAMRASEGKVPWQRVVGRRRRGVAQVTIKDPVGGAVQRQLLEKEGVRFDARGGIDLARYGVSPEKKNGRSRRRGRPLVKRGR